ncbi:hypothetical protein CEUSTIGMA_g2670.t1 [Chlamydomonas eustigma]|uniref:HMG box domain-containing protein n=1 Tax=Chlamydomonas eustigma TaxID=1157962 RepID=A0A250WWS8_9CHLO|nr:hypothetical protein CEUSTIGMA_g2670.t1 [Chlamydomonas eustigma]|eukprot:GAX75226.1 hypothetical protein CEUSTIGMA_g2670.t1 [Chlamydomonas eustigma]
MQASPQGNNQVGAFLTFDHCVAKRCYISCLTVKTQQRRPRSSHVPKFKMPKAKAEKSEKKAKGKKEKKEKDPNAPKKPLGAYMFFCAEMRPKVKEEHPDFKITEMASKLGELWKELDEKAKKKFQDKAEKDKERYQKALEKYKAESKGGAAEEEEEEDEE